MSLQTCIVLYLHKKLADTLLAELCDSTSKHWIMRKLSMILTAEAIMHMCVAVDTLFQTHDFHA